MAILNMTNTDVYAGALDLSSNLNKVTLNAKADELDATTFGATYRVRAGGLKDVMLSHEGFANFATTDPDATLFPDLKTQRVCTVSPTGADTATAYFFEGTRFEYVPIDAQVGDLCGFSGSVQGSDGFGLIRGNLLLPKQTISGVVNGTAVQLGAVGAAQFLYTAIHCFTAGTTVTVIVESAAASNMVGATTRSSTVVTATGGTWVTRVAGSITDTWWRVRTASVTGSFSLAAAVGIQ